MPARPESPSLLDKPAAAAYLGISTVTLDRRVRSGDLRSRRGADGRVMFTRHDLDALRAGGRVRLNTRRKF